MMCLAVAACSMDKGVDAAAAMPPLELLFDRGGQDGGRGEAKPQKEPPPALLLLDGNGKKIEK